MRKLLCAALLIVLLCAALSAQLAGVSISGTFPDGEVDEEYPEYFTTNVTISSGSVASAYQVELVDGALPDGLTLSVRNFVTSYISLEGTPTKARTYTFTIMATDFVGSIGQSARLMHHNHLLSQTVMLHTNGVTAELCHQG